MNTRTIRSSQQASFEQVAGKLAGLSDSDLNKVSFAISMAHVEILERESENCAAVEAVCWLRDIVVDEYNHRQKVFYDTQADFNGGHLLNVALDGSELGKWQAGCWPVWDGPKCWEGPNRDTLEEAVADAKAHCPTAEPEIYGDIPY